MTYTNDIEVEVDFSDVDPNLLNQDDSEQQVAVLSTTQDNDSSNDKSLVDNSESTKSNLGLGDDDPKPTIAGRAARFFRKKN